MLLKIMGSENLPDDSPYKSCTVLSGVKCVNYKKDESKRQAFLDVVFEGSREEFFLGGNAYLMNDAGKTVQAFSALEGTEPPKPDARYQSKYVDLSDYDDRAKLHFYAYHPGMKQEEQKDFYSLDSGFEFDSFLANNLSEDQDFDEFTIYDYRRYHVAAKSVLHIVKGVVQRSDVQLIPIGHTWDALREKFMEGNEVIAFTSEYFEKEMAKWLGVLETSTSLKDLPKLAHEIERMRWLRDEVSGSSYMTPAKKGELVGRILDTADVYRQRVQMLLRF